MVDLGSTPDCRRFPILIPPSFLQLSLYPLMADLSSFLAAFLRSDLRTRDNAPTSHARCKEPSSCSISQRSGQLSAGGHALNTPVRASVRCYCICRRFLISVPMMTLWNDAILSQLHGERIRGTVTVKVKVNTDDGSSKRTSDGIT